MNKNLFQVLFFLMFLTVLYSCQEESEHANPYDIYVVDVPSILNVRKEPSAEADKLGALQKNELVDVESINNG